MRVQQQRLRRAWGLDADPQPLLGSARSTRVGQSLRAGMPASLRAAATTSLSGSGSSSTGSRDLDLAKAEVRDRLEAPRATPPLGLTNERAARRTARKLDPPSKPDVHHSVLADVLLDNVSSTLAAMASKHLAMSTPSPAESHEARILLDEQRVLFRSDWAQRPGGTPRDLGEGRALLADDATDHPFWYFYMRFHIFGGRPRLTKAPA